MNFDPNGHLYTERGGACLLRDGRAFIFNGSREQVDNRITVYWRCRKRGCRASYNVIYNNADDMEVVQETAGGNHNANCVQSDHLLINEKAKDYIRRGIESRLDTARRIYRHVIQRLRSPQYTTQAYREDVTFGLPAFPSLVEMRSLMQRAYQRAFPPLPHSFQNITQQLIAEYFGVLYDEARTRFLLSVHHLGPTVGCMLVFATDEFLTKLCLANKVFMDGTFKCAPTIVARHHRRAQLFTNNAVEGWHYRLNQHLGQHKNIWKVIEGLQEEQQDYEVLAMQHHHGHAVTRPNQYYRAMQRAIAARREAFIASNYDAPLEYLMHVSNHLIAAKYNNNDMDFEEDV